MINKDKAIAAAEEILAVERRRVNEQQNEKAALIPVSLRVHGLSSLEPRHQAALMREAEKTVHAKWALKAWAVAWVASISIVWFFSSSDQSKFGLLWVITPALGVLWLRHWFIRRELNRLVSSTISHEAERDEA